MRDTAGGTMFGWIGWFGAACTPDPAGRPPPATDTTETGTGACGARAVALDVSAAPTGREHDRLVTLTLDQAADAALLCRADDDPDDRVLLESPAAVQHAFHVQGLRADTSYACVAGATCASPGDPRSVTITTGPARFAPQTEVAVAEDADLPRGWLLTAVLTRGCRGPGTLAVFDPAGRVRWDLPLVDARMDFEVLPIDRDTILYGGATPVTGPVAVHLWDGDLWRASLPDAREFHHDAKMLPDGRVLTLEARTVTDGATSWRGFGARTFDPATMTVGWEYSSQAGVDEGVLPAGPGDPWHANWLDWLDPGEGTGDKLYVSLCNLGQVVRIDADTETIDWTFGPGGDFALADRGGEPLPDEQFPQCQHGLEVSADGSRMLVYDNGRERPSSRVVEFALDRDPLRATLLWEWTDGWKENILGDVDWLVGDDGGQEVLVTQGHPECYDGPGDRSEVVWFDPEPTGGRTVERWRLVFVDPWMAMYRSQWVDGCTLLASPSACPALEARWAALAPGFGLAP